MTEVGEIITVRGEPCRVVDRFPIKDSEGKLLCYGLEAKPLKQCDAEAPQD